jgi:hypothetical protein
MQKPTKIHEKQHFKRHRHIGIRHERTTKDTLNEILDKRTLLGEQFREHIARETIDDVISKIKKFRSNDNDANSRIWNKKLENLISAIEKIKS